MTAGDRLILYRRLREAGWEEPARAAFAAVEVPCGEVILTIIPDPSVEDGMVKLMDHHGRIVGEITCQKTAGIRP